MAEGYFECDVRCSTINTHDGFTRIKYCEPEKVVYKDKLLWIRNVHTARNIRGERPWMYRTIPLEDTETSVVGYPANGELEYLSNSKDFVLKFKEDEIDVLSDVARVRLKVRVITDSREQDTIKNHLIEEEIVPKAAKIRFIQGSELEQISSTV